MVAQFAAQDRRGTRPNVGRWAARRRRFAVSTALVSEVSEVSDLPPAFPDHQDLRITDFTDHEACRRARARARVGWRRGITDFTDFTYRAAFASPAAAAI